MAKGINKKRDGRIALMQMMKKMPSEKEMKTEREQMKEQKMMEKFHKTRGKMK